MSGFLASGHLSYLLVVRTKDCRAFAACLREYIQRISQDERSKRRGGQYELSPTEGPIHFTVPV